MATTTTTTKAAKPQWLKGGLGVEELKSYENTANYGAGVYMLTVLASCKGRTYQMRLLLNNSKPLGFNSQRCVSVLADGWKPLADDAAVCMNSAVSAYDQLPAIRAYAKKLFRAFEEYVSCL